MVKKKSVVLLAVVIVVIILFLGVTWIMHTSKLIEDDNYTKLTVTMNFNKETALVITDKNQIDEMIKIINDSPRKYHRTFSYDYLEHGYLIFENNQGNLLKIFLLVNRGDVLIDHWEVDTNFRFK